MLKRMRLSCLRELLGLRAEVQVHRCTKDAEIFQFQITLITSVLHLLITKPIGVISSLCKAAEFWCIFSLAPCCLASSSVTRWLVMTAGGPLCPCTYLPFVRGENGCALHITVPHITVPPSQVGHSKYDFQKYLHGSDDSLWDVSFKVNSCLFLMVLFVFPIKL